MHAQPAWTTIPCATHTETAVDVSASISSIDQQNSNSQVMNQVMNQRGQIASRCDLMWQSRKPMFVAAAAIPFTCHTRP